VPGAVEAISGGEEAAEEDFVGGEPIRLHGLTRGELLIEVRQLRYRVRFGEVRSQTRPIAADLLRQG
jgi:hypothetical protein